MKEILPHLDNYFRTMDDLVELIQIKTAVMVVWVLLSHKDKEEHKAELIEAILGTLYEYLVNKE